jgi:hypothetical protein
MAYTLADYARLADSDLKAGIVDILRTESLIMDYMSFENWDQLNMEIIRTKSLPTVGTRKINESWSESKGQTDTVQASMSDIGGYIDVDKLLVRAKSIKDPRALQTQLFTRAVALKFNSLFFKGNPSVNEDEFAGLRYYLINLLPSSQTVLGAGLDISPDSSALAADSIKLIDALHDAIHQCDGHKADFFFCNDTMKIRLGAALRSSGMLKTTEDAYGRKFETFGEGGPKIVDVGPTDPLDKTARIIGNLESDDGSSETSGDATSVYVVKFGGGEYVEGFQLYPMEVDDIGMLESGVAFRSVIDWPVGMYMTHPWSVSRVVGIVAA